MNDPKTIQPLDNERVLLSQRERICLKILLFAIGLIRPGKYDHQIDSWIKFIREEL